MRAISDIPFSLIKFLCLLRGRASTFNFLSSPGLSNKNIKPFFIVGCGRSGSTLLRAMLTAGKQVNIPPESYVLPRVTRLFISYRYLPWEQLVGIIISEFEAFQEFFTWELDLSPVHRKARELSKKEQTLANIIDLIYREYATKFNLSALRWGDKTPKNSEFLEHICEVFPDAQYIHLIRDPRAVLSSYINAALKDNNLITDRQKIVKFWLNCHKHIENCKSIVGEDKFVGLHYENLLNNPEEELKRVTGFLGIEFSSEMLSFWQSKSLGDVNHYKHHENVLKPLNKSPIGLWKEKLSNSDKHFVEEHCMNSYNVLLKKYELTI